jgi:hypothetical protein
VPPAKQTEAFQSGKTALSSKGSQALFRVPGWLPEEGRATHAERETSKTIREKAMTKKQSTGIALMIGSAAVGIQLTLFSPILRGWFYSVCLGALIIVFASGAELLRGSE